MAVPFSRLKRSLYAKQPISTSASLIMVPLITTLADYLLGEFDNREQAIAAPVWYVHLRLWHRPVSLFTQDSITVFAEQANVLQLEQPYRQRLLRIQAQESDSQFPLTVQYYKFNDFAAVRGAGQNPDLLQEITEEQIERLPGCFLQVAHQHDRFIATPLADTRCCFSYQGETIQVSLGFEVNSQQFLSYDKGIEPDTGKALWGAMMGAYEFTKRRGV